MSESEQLQRWNKEELVRKAEVAFITDALCRSVEFWWEQLCREVISLPRLRERATQGRWLLRRDRFRASVTQEVLRETKRRTVRDLVSELSELQALRSNLLELATPYVIDGQRRYRVQPQSLEGVVRAFVQVDELVGAKRTSVLQQVEPELEREMKRPQSVFTPDEIRGVARMLLEGRRARQQQQLPMHQKEASDGDNGQGKDGQGKDGEG